METFFTMILLHLCVVSSMWVICHSYEYRDELKVTYIFILLYHDGWRWLRNQSHQSFCQWPQRQHKVCILPSLSSFLKTKIWSLLFKALDVSIKSVIWCIAWYMKMLLLALFHCYFFCIHVVAIRCCIIRE